ncbi:MAG: hypothetical protein KME26_11780 [Oscillatoria princeps RMCB-10]|nr:hypothetical protein [Oscillatoria princeps RMCB-10]
MLPRSSLSSVSFQSPGCISQSVKHPSQVFVRGKCLRAGATGLFDGLKEGTSRNIIAQMRWRRLR